MANSPIRDTRCVTSATEAGLATAVVDGMLNTANPYQSNCPPTDPGYALKYRAVTGEYAETQSNGANYWANIFFEDRDGDENLITGPIGVGTLLYEPTMEVGIFPTPVSAEHHQALLDALGT